MNKILPNGATIIAIDFSVRPADDISLSTGVVLAYTNEVPHIGPKYITWAFYGDDLASTSNGHYCADLAEARADFNDRVKRGY